MKRWFLLIAGGFATSLQLVPTTTAQDQPIDPASFEAMLKDTRVDPASADRALTQRGLLDPIQRGSIPTVPVDWFENFQTHPLSTDPVFDRFQVAPGQGHLNPVFNWTAPTSINAIPSLFIDGQTDEFGTPDPLPRWGGIALVESLPTASADLNGNGMVDSSDLALLIGAFGTTCSGCVADINNDGEVNSSDLALCIGVFGEVVGPFCVYEVSLVQPVDDAGMPLPPGTLDDGPFIGDRIALTASPSCGTCDRFSLKIDGVRVFGDWTLEDTNAPDLFGVAYFGTKTSADCPPIASTERVLAMVRGETGAWNPTCCFQYTNGILANDSDFATMSSIADGIDLVCEMDIFLSSYDTFIWTDFTSGLDGLTVSRFFTGGVGANISSEFGSFSNIDGLLDRFVILGSDCGAPFCAGGIGGLYGTVPDPDYIDPVSGVVTPLPGKIVKSGEWFTIRHVVTTQYEHEVWVRDSETIALVDPLLGDDGGSTDSILDDIEDGFAKIFPVGPYGRTRLSSGRLTENVAVPIAASATRVRTIFGAEDGTLQRANRNYFIDNIRISGVSPIITPPPLSLPYSDGLENYLPFIQGQLSYITAGRWFSADTDDGSIRESNPHSGVQYIEQVNRESNGAYEPVIWTNLPRSIAIPSVPWRVGLWHNSWGRGYTPMDSVTGEDVCTVLTGVVIPAEPPFSNSYEVNPVTGFVPIFIRQRNPHFDPALPVDERLFHQQPPQEVPGDPGYPNLEFINVRTGAFVESIDTYVHLEIEVDSTGILRLFFDGIEYFPSDPDRFFDVIPGDITNFRADSLAIDQLRFDTANAAPDGAGIDDISLTGQPAP